MTGIPTFSVRVKPEHQDMIRGVARFLKEQPEQADKLRRFLTETEINPAVIRLKYESLEDRVQGLEDVVRELADAISLLEMKQKINTAELPEGVCNTDVLQFNGVAHQGEPLAGVGEGQSSLICDELQKNTNVLHDVKQPVNQPVNQDNALELLALLDSMKARGMNLEAMAVELNQGGWRTVKGALWSKSNLSGWWKRQREEGLQA